MTVTDSKVKLTTVDKFVRKQIMTYPSLFPNRSAVLHHALCVIGNGYKWSERGTIVRDSRRPTPPLWNLKEERAKLEAEENHPYKSRIVKLFALAEIRKEFNECAKVVEEIDIRVHERVKIKNFYPQCDYALLMNIPDKVNSDWKEACEEMKFFAQQEGWIF